MIDCDERRYTFMCGRFRLNLLCVNRPGTPRETDPVHMKTSPDHNFNHTGQNKN